MSNTEYKQSLQFNNALVKLKEDFSQKHKITKDNVHLDRLFSLPTPFSQLSQLDTDECHILYSLGTQWMESASCDTKSAGLGIGFDSYQATNVDIVTIHVLRPSAKSCRA